MSKRNEFRDFSGYVTVCAQCGYRFARGDEALRIKQTGDVVHSECYIDYTDDNRGELADILEF